MARSASACSRLSPSTPSTVTLRMPGARCVGWPFSSTPGIAASASQSRSRSAEIRAASDAHLHRCDRERASHAGDLVRRQRAGAQAAFLAAAVQQGHEAEARLAAHDSAPTPLGPCTLCAVSASRSMQSRSTSIGQLARALRRVDVQQHAPRAAEPPDRADVLHHADLVLHVHERHEDRVRRAAPPRPATAARCRRVPA